MRDALHHLVVCADIERSGSIRNGARPAVREGLHALIVSTLATVGVGPQLYRKEDRGDGALILVEPSVPKAWLLGRWLIELHEQMREWNRERASAIRLRVGLHCGEVRRDAEGFSGEAVDLTFRLTDSAIAHSVLADAPDATLAVIVSERLFGDVVADGGQYIESANYRRVHVSEPSIVADARVYIPRLGAPSVPAGGTGADGAREERAEPRDTPKEHRAVTTKVYNEFAGPVTTDFANFGVMENAKIGGADDE